MSDEKRDDGGSAFPYSALTPRGPEMYADAKGMNLRDYFAAQATIGLIACYSKVNNQTFPYADDIVVRAYELADFMLQERAK